MKDGRGSHMKEARAKNTGLVKAFFNDNPDATQADCMKYLKLSAPTVRSILVELGMK